MGEATATLGNESRIAVAETISGAGVPITVVEAATLANAALATFTVANGSPDPSTLTSTIEWGDGTTSAGSITLSAGTYTVSGSHAYSEEGSKLLVVTLADASAGATASTTATATISDPAVVATGGFTYAATEGTSGAAQTVVTFTDPGGAEPLADYAATIDWGDGTRAAGATLSVDPHSHVFTVSGAHAYAQDGTFTVAVTITHETAIAVTVASTAQITPGTITSQGGIAASGVALSGHEFSTLSSMAVSTFTDTNASLTASDFSATIDWGDGTTSAGSVAVSLSDAGGTSAPQFTVNGSHEYLDEGHYTLSLSIQQTAGPATGATSATVVATATIHEQLLGDGTIGTPDQNYIQEIYRDLFARQAELQGLDDWVGLLASGVPRATVAYEMIKVAASEEFQYDTVESLYRQYLHRAPEPEGLEFWVTYLYQGGGTIEGMAEALIGSNEYYQTRGAGTVSGFLHAVFEDVLGREIDAGALTYFTSLIADGRTTFDVAAMVFSSAEYEHVRVNDLYEQLLDRPADRAGLDYYAAELVHGVTDESIIAQMLSSNEYFAKPQE